MYPGYLALGTIDPIGHPEDFIEIINNARTYAYAQNAGICWLNECSDCDPTKSILPGWPYGSPVSDPAPWLDTNNPDSAGFFGLIGLDVTGEDSSTRQTSVKMGLSGVGIIGPSYMAPRTMVVRALAIAEDECSLQYGLTWLRASYRAAHNPCGGDTMTFFDCCPCVCDDPAVNTDCWPDSYHELRVGPPCIYPDWWVRTYDEEKAGPPAGEVPWWPSSYDEEEIGPPVPMYWYDTYDEEMRGPGNPYWPDTYGELIVGPGPDDPVWCMWVDIYRELREGTPDWSCCVEACVTPYIRQFDKVRVTEGPTVLQSPQLHSKGAVAEVEFTIVAADPVVHGEIQRAGSKMITGGTSVFDSPPPPVYRNPYRDIGVELEPTPAFVPTEWVRDSFDVARIKEQVLTGIEPRVRVRTSERSGPVRLGLWQGETRVAGYTIPFVAESSSLVITGHDVYHLSPNGYEKVSAFVRDWDGKWPRPADLPHGDYRLTVDQRPESAVKLFVDVSVAAVGEP